MRNLALASILLAAVPAAGDPPELSPEHRAWLDDVVPILSDVEREAFFSRADIADRDGFIAEFWLARDPTPGTERNEFREQHRARLDEADRKFRRGKRRGSHTSRGRLYVQLGPPIDLTRYAQSAQTYPIEHWVYRGGQASGQSGILDVLFFKPYGAGEWELYDPVIHGPTKLTTGIADGRRFPSAMPSAAESFDSDMGSDIPSSSGTALSLADPTEVRRRALMQLRFVDPLLERLAASLDRTDGSRDGRLRLGASAIVARLHDLPNRLPFEREYVDRLLGGEPRVEVEYRYGSTEVRSLFHATHGVNGGQLHYLIELPPSALSMYEYEGESTATLELVGRIFEAEDDVPVLQVDERIELTLDAAGLEQLRSSPLAIEDRLPLLPGTYEAHFLVRNKVTAELSAINATFVIPERPAAGFTLLEPLLVARSRALAEGGGAGPFVFAGRRSLPAVGGQAPAGGELVALITLAHGGGDGGKATLQWRLVSGGEEAVEGRGKLRLDDDGVTRHELRGSLAGVTPGSYALQVQVTRARTEPVTATTAVEVVAGQMRPPWLYVVGRDGSVGAEAMILAEQFLARGDDAAATRLLERVISSAAGATEAAELRLLLAELHLEAESFAAALSAIEPLAMADEASPRMLLVLGLARSGDGDAAGAIAAFRAATDKAPGAVDLWNILGEEHLRAGEEDRALLAFRHSLELDPYQFEIKQLVDELAAN